MAIRGELKGAEELSRQLQRYGQAVVREAEKVVARAGNNVRNRAINKIQRSPATGRIYTRGNVVHQASAPGEPPATDTGVLANSISLELSGLSARVGTSIEYGAYLEFGTMHIAERPWLHPSVREEQGAYRQDMVNTINGIKP